MKWVAKWYTSEKRVGAPAECHTFFLRVPSELDWRHILGAALRDKGSLEKRQLTFQSPPLNSNRLVLLIQTNTMEGGACFKINKFNFCLPTANSESTNRFKLVS